MCAASVDSNVRDRSHLGLARQQNTQAIVGYCGQVDSIVHRLRDELGANTHTIATGGLSAAIVPYCETIDEIDDLLTLTGLRLIHEKNV